MGLIHSITQSVQAVLSKPLAPSSLKTVASGFAGVPLIKGQVGSTFGSAFSKNTILAQVHDTFQPVIHNNTFEWGKRVGETKVGSVVFPFLSVFTKKGRQRWSKGNGSIAIVAIVAVVCWYVPGVCGAAVTAGMTGIGAVNAKRSGADDGVAGGPGDQPPGSTNEPGAGGSGAAADLAAGNFDGLGTSLDPSTLAGQKTLIALGAIAGILTTGYLLYKTMRK